jgi:hypothetical protein
LDADHPEKGVLFAPGPLGGAQHKSDRKRRIDTEQHHRHEHDRKRGVKAAEAHIVYGVENKAQYRVGKAWQHQEVDGRNANDHSENGCRHRAIGDEAAEK